MTTSSSQTALKGKSLTGISWFSVIIFSVFHIVALSAPWFFSWPALGAAIAVHWLCGSIGICMSYHRLLTHRSFQVPKWLEYILATVGALALQGGPIFWVAGHRLHHAHTEDVDKDPYSATRGFWWSHMAWLLYPRKDFFNKDVYQRFAPDLARDPYYRWLDRNFALLQIPLALVLYALGGWPFIIYGVFLSRVLLWHSTWFINSASHIWGYRTFDCDDNSRNLWWAAILAYGEGWHNNHHANPNVAPAGYQWWEYDPTWWAIKVLQMAGLAKKVVMPTARAAVKG